MGYATRATRSATGSAVQHFPPPPHQTVHQSTLRLDSVYTEMKHEKLCCLFIEERRKRMNAAFQGLTGEDGDNPPHSAVSQVTAGLGHSHGGRKINIHTRKSGFKPPSCRPVSVRPCALSSGSLKCAPLLNAPPRPPTLTPTFNRHSSCYGSCWGLTSRDSAAATSSMLGAGLLGGENGDEKESSGQ